MTLRYLWLSMTRCTGGSARSGLPRSCGRWPPAFRSSIKKGQLLGGGPELLRMMGDARSELFHYEVRSTYDTPEVADNRRIVEEAQRQDSFLPDDPEDEEPWRPTRPE